MEEINWKIARLLQFIISNVFPMYLLHRLARVTGKRNVILPPTVILIYMFWTVSTQGSTVINFRCVLLCEASFKTFFNTVPKNTFWDIFYGLLPNLMKNFQKAFRLDTHKKKYRHPWNPKSTLHIFWRKSDFVVVGGVGGWRGYLYVGERSTNSDSPFHSNCKDWFQLIFHLELAVNSFAS